MRKLMIFTAVLGAVAMPVSAQAASTDEQNAAQECRFERGTTAPAHEAFAVKYGTNAGNANAFGKCVSRTARQERVQRSEAKTGAPKACTAEQGTTAESKAAFALKYGTNGKGKNAFGKCVSIKARELKQQADTQDRKDATARKRAAKTCHTERGTTTASRKAFADKYGSNANRRNAFGKCVSTLAKTLKGEDRQAA